MPEVGLTIPQRPKCKAATLGSNMLKTRSNTVYFTEIQYLIDQLQHLFGILFHQIHVLHSNSSLVE